MFKKKQQPVPPRPRVTRLPEQNKTFSYYASRQVEHPSSRGRMEDMALDMRHERRHMQLRQVPMFLASLVIVGCIGYNFLLGTDPRVIFVGDAEARTLLQEPATYESAITDALSESVLNRTKFTFQGDDVQQSLIEAFPELGSIRVSLPLMGIKPVVHVTPAVPVVVLVAENGASYVLDGTGRVISVEVNKVPQGLPVITDRSDLQPELGQQALPSRDIQFIKRFMYQLARKDYSLESLTLPAGSQELQVRERGSRYFVRTSLREDPVEQAGALAVC